MSVIRKMSEEQLLECRRYFSNQDHNKDNQISWDEYNAMIDAIGLNLTDQRRHNAFQMADKDGNGFISFVEFVAAYMTNDDDNTHEESQHPEPVTALSPAKLLQVRGKFYRKSSCSGYGKLSPVEFVDMIATLGIIMTNEELNQVLDLAENDSEGLISFVDFSAACIKEEDQANYNYCLLKPFYKREGSIPEEMTEFEIVECCKYFWYADKDTDGRLSPTEFLKMLDVLGMGTVLDEKQRKAAFEMADSDGDGLISFYEFVNAYLNTGERKVLTNKNIKEFFYKYDKDKTGVLSRQECVEALKMLGHKFRIKRLERIIDAMDKDHDDVITLNEFCEFLDIVE